MKRYIILIGIVVAMYSCNDDIYNNITEMVDSEKIYPTGYNQQNVVARSGENRVEIDLYGSRLNAAEMAKIMPKAKKTVVEYGDVQLVIDSVCSWVNVTNLTVPNSYRFVIYTENEWGDKSIPVTVHQKPFTSVDRDALLFTASSTASATVSLIVCGTAPDLYTFFGASYSYTDKDNIPRSGQTKDSKFILTNLSPGASTTVNIACHLLPIGAIDTVWVNGAVTVKTITQQAFDDYINNTTPFPAGSQHILTAAAPYYLPAADFDMGGEGFGFHKVGATTEGDRNYRADGGDPVWKVELYTGVAGAYAVAWIDNEDWVIYTIEVQDPGEYKVELNYTGGDNSNTNTCTFDLMDFFGTIRLPSTPATSAWTQSEYRNLGTVNLTAGKHKMKWTFFGGNPGPIGFRFTKI
ncbi:hypothetical protein FACS189430_06040 [Bacteroidia bacterium]|nr:hypothetical protein FACS189430_06040 [Bacteroidia bacterium]